jgi:hypothetical protein
MVRMVTGDNIATARSIARECGILTDDGVALEGPDFRKLSPEALDHLLPKLQVQWLLALQDGNGKLMSWALHTSKCLTLAVSLLDITVLLEVLLLVLVHTLLALHYRYGSSVLAVAL